MFITVSLTNILILHKFSATLNIVLTVMLISQKIILELYKNSQLMKKYEYIFPRQRSPNSNKIYYNDLSQC